MIVAFIVFCCISLLIGLSLRNSCKFEKESEGFLVSFLFGVCSFPILGIIISHFEVLNLYLIGGVLILILIFFHKEIISKFKNRISFSRNELVVLILCSLMFGVFYIGINQQFWIEDGDPNGHAMVSSYIARYNTIEKPADLYIARYIEPYTVGYQAWMGLLAQDGMDVLGTLRLYNSIFICVSFIGFFYLCKEIFKDDNKAFASTFILWSLATYSTRFIFAQTLGILQTIMVLYFIFKILNGRAEFKWALVISIASLILTHQTTGIVAAIFIGCVLGAKLIRRDFNKYCLLIINLGILGTCLAGVWFGYEYNKYGWDKMRYQMNLGKMGEGVIGLSDPTLRLYTLKDYITVPFSNSIDNMTGIGLVVFLLLLFGVVKFVERRTWTDISVLGMFFVTTLCVFSNWLPISFIPHRMWVYMSIPLAMISGEVLSNYLIGKEKIFGWILVIGILLTSFYPKYVVNSNPWESARLHNDDEYKMSVYLTNFGNHSKIMDVCSYERIWAMNMWDDPLDTQSLLYRNNKVNTSIYGWDSEEWIKLKSINDSSVFFKSAIENDKYLKEKSYNYIWIGSKCEKYMKIDVATYSGKVQEFVDSGLFILERQFGNEYLLRIKN